MSLANSQKRSFHFFLCLSLCSTYLALFHFSKPHSHVFLAVSRSRETFLSIRNRHPSSQSEVPPYTLDNLSCLGPPGSPSLSSSLHLGSVSFTSLRSLGIVRYAQASETTLLQLRHSFLPRPTCLSIPLSNSDRYRYPVVASLTTVRQSKISGRPKSLTYSIHNISSLALLIYAADLT